MLLVKIKLEEVDALGVRGGWNICDFAPDSLGSAAPVRSWFVAALAWKLNAPGIALGEFVIGSLPGFRSSLIMLQNLVISIRRVRAHLLKFENVVAIEVYDRRAKHQRISLGLELDSM